jgi:transcriptional regulator with XRE-family HTH domain
MFDKRLKELRKKKGITQEELARHLSLSTSTIGEYEIGGNSPKVDTLIRLSKYFNVTVDYLLGLTEDEKTENVLIGVDTTGLSEDDIKFAIGIVRAAKSAQTKKQD